MAKTSEAAHRSATLTERTTTMARKGPIHYRRALAANVDALYAREITPEQFHARNCATWDAIRAAGRRTENAVLRIIRADLYGRA